MVAWTHRRRKRLLIAANLLLVGGIGCCAWFALGTPTDLAGIPDEARAERRTAAEDHEPLTGPLAQYAVIHERPWRKPLFDPKPGPIAVAKKPEPKMTAVLTGTITDPAFSRAVFRTSRGEEKLVAVGEAIDGAEVRKIAYEQVVVEFHGKQLTLTPEKGPLR